MDRSITLALMSTLVLAFGLRVEGLSAQAPNGTATTVDVGSSTAAVKTMPDGVYWGLVQNVDAQLSAVWFVPLCTGLLAVDFGKLPPDEQIPHWLPIAPL